VRAKLQCGGYERQRIFVQMTPEDGANGSLGGLKPRSRSTSPTLLPDSLALSAFEINHLAEFWQTYLPGVGGQSAASPPQEGLLGITRWISSVQQLYVSDLSLKKALLAMSLSTVGKQTGQKWMVEEGLRQQIGAVNLMKKAVKAPTPPQSEAVLATARLISLFVVSLNTRHLAVLHGHEQGGH
jgi:hypothetical protein